MASGNKRLVYNTRERLLSDDHNREQAFEAADVAALLARTFLPLYAGDRGVSTLDETQGAPPTALIVDGLMFRPIDGSVNALVDAGTVVMSDPDVSPSGDDVPWKWVHFDGVEIAGQLQLTPNPGGVRIDVVEFSRTEEVVEYDNRDKFNTGTGLFDPVPVEKVRRGALVFRIRLGIVGSSFPGVVAGWVPIAVCRVPAVANDWDVVTVWDVRPLLADRRSPGPRVADDTPRVTRQLLRSDLATIYSSSGATVRIFGIVEGELGEWRVGGLLGRSVPGTMADYVEATETAAQEGSGVSFDADARWYLYALFPYGLPAWRRYSDPGVGGRVPAAHRGIAVVSKKPPRFTGRPSEIIYPPNSTSLQNGAYALQTHPTLCLTAGSTSGAPFTPLPRGIVADGSIIHSIFGETPKPADTITASAATFALTAHADFPDNARAIHVRIAYIWAASGADSLFGLSEVLRISDALGTASPLLIQAGSTTPIRSAAGFGFEGVFTARVPLDPYRDEAGPRAFELEWQFGGNLPAGVTINPVTIEVFGWEIGG